MRYGCVGSNKNHTIYSFRNSNCVCHITMSVVEPVDEPWSGAGSAYHAPGSDPRPAVHTQAGTHAACFSCLINGCFLVWPFGSK